MLSFGLEGVAVSATIPTCIYALSDIHANYQALKDALTIVAPRLDADEGSVLVFLGDYLHGEPDEAEAVLDEIIALEKHYGARIVTLKGNHEHGYLLGDFPFKYSEGDANQCKAPAPYDGWLKNLHRYYKVSNTIFVHAGIDEEAAEEDAELWATGTSDDIMFGQFPPRLGAAPIPEIIVAGHVYTHEIAADPTFTNIYWDGQSHIYIDSDVAKTGRLNILKVVPRPDADRDEYWQVDAAGDHRVEPYKPGM
jgi:serine/threonine protein phosphatase 1